MRSIEPGVSKLLLQLYAVNSVSSPRMRGPITTGWCCWPRCRSSFRNT